MKEPFKVYKFCALAILDLPYRDFCLTSNERKNVASFYEKFFLLFDLRDNFNKKIDSLIGEHSVVKIILCALKRFLDRRIRKECFVLGFKSFRHAFENHDHFFRRWIGHINFFKSRHKRRILLKSIMKTINITHGNDLKFW